MNTAQIFMHRFFVDSVNVNGENITITNDAKHIAMVLRLNIGDNILVCDGSGYEYEASLLKVGKDECTAKIIEKKLSEYEPEIRVTLFQGVPKAGKMESIIQKSVELGVFEIVPYINIRTVVKFDGDKAKKDKTERWQKIAVEALKQCGRGIVPKVIPPLEFKDILNIFDEFDLIVMPYEIFGSDGRKNLKEVLKGNHNARKIAIIIGPEGGFAEEEAFEAEEKGAVLVGLGKRILRTETAGSAVLSMIMYEFGEI